MRPSEPKEKLVVVLNEPVSLKVQKESPSKQEAELELKLLPTQTEEDTASRLTEEASE